MTRLHDPDLDATSGPSGAGVESVPLSVLRREAPAGVFVLLRAVLAAAPSYTIPTGATVLADLAALIRGVDEGTPGAITGLDLIGRCKPGLFGTPRNAEIAADQERFLGRDPTPTLLSHSVLSAGAEVAHALDTDGTPRYVVAVTGVNGFPVAITVSLRAAEGAIYATATALLEAGHDVVLDVADQPSRCTFTAARLDPLTGDSTSISAPALLRARLGFAPHDGPSEP